jgi:hypothetical protein
MHTSAKLIGKVGHEAYQVPKERGSLDIARVSWQEETAFTGSALIEQPQPRTWKEERAGARTRIEAPVLGVQRQLLFRLTVEARVRQQRDDDDRHVLPEIVARLGQTCLGVIELDLVFFHLHQHTSVTYMLMLSILDLARRQLQLCHNTCVVYVTYARMFFFPDTM